MPSPPFLDNVSSPSLDVLFQTVFADAPVGVGLLDRDLRYIYVSPYLAFLNGVPASAHLGRRVQEVIPDLVPLLDPILRGVLETGQAALDTEIVGRATAAGVTRQWLAQYYPARNARGEVIGISALILDVSETRQVQAAVLHRSELALARALDAAQMGIWDWDFATDEVRWSEGRGRLFGLAPEDFRGTLEAFFAVVHPEDRAAILSGVARARDERTEYRQEYRVLRADGGVHWVEATGRCDYDAAGAALRMSGVTRDITERKRRDEQIQCLAYSDALTGLPNRSLYLDRLSQALALAERRREMLAVLFLDLDRFKHVNDSLGHLAGDVLLQSVARRLSAVLRPEDTLARMGGDEFTLLLTDPHGPEDAARVAQRVLDTLADPFTVEGHELFVTGSVGISLYPTDGPDAPSLLRHAEVAMYRAKEQGRNGYQLFTEQMNAAAFERLVLESSLHRGLAHGEFTLFYQPVVSSDGQIVGAEALVRWRHPDLGLVSPAKFIPLAEETGLIVPLGHWVLETACRQAAAWFRSGHPLGVSVNLSARQLRRPDLVRQVASSLADVGLPAEWLTLELTESALITTGEAAVSVLEGLRALGVSIAVDDFGTGYSSLSYLRHLPVDVLKVDRAFVQDMVASQKDRTVVWAILALAHGLGLKVVAEGVETEAQRECLCGMNCDALQGYLISPPLAAAEFEAFVQGSGHAESWA